MGWSSYSKTIFFINLYIRIYFVCSLSFICSGSILSICLTNDHTIIGNFALILKLIKFNSSSSIDSNLDFLPGCIVNLVLFNWAFS